MVMNVLRVSRWTGVLLLGWIGGWAVEASLVVAEEASPAELARQLRSDDADTRRAALEKLAASPDQARQVFPDLIKRFRDPVPELRVLAAKAVAGTGEAGQKWLPHFVRLFHDHDTMPDDKPVSYHVARIVGQVMGKAVLDDLIALLENGDVSERRGACVAIYEIGPEAKAAVPVLVKLLESGSNDVNLESLYALRGIGPAAEEALPALIRALDAQNMHTQYWAAQALAAMGEKAVPAVPTLIRKLKTGTASVRRHAAIALGKIGPKIGKAGIDALIEAMGDFSFVVREDTLDALARLGPAAAEAGPVIQEKLVERKLEPIGKALYAYWRITGQSDFVEPRFLARMKDLNGIVEAVPELAKMGHAAAFAVPKLVELTRNTDPVVRLLSVEALGKIGVSNDAVKQALQERLAKEGDEDVRAAAETALKSLAGEAEQSGDM